MEGWMFYQNIAMGIRMKRAIINPTTIKQHFFLLASRNCSFALVT